MNRHYRDLLRATIARRNYDAGVGFIVVAVLFYLCLQTEWHAVSTFLLGGGLVAYVGMVAADVQVVLMLRKYTSLPDDDAGESESESGDYSWR